VHTVSLEPAELTAFNAATPDLFHILRWMARPKISRKGPCLDRTPMTQWLGSRFATPSTTKRSASSLQHSYSRPSLSKKQERDTRRAMTRDFAARIECDYRTFKIPAPAPHTETNIGDHGSPFECRTRADSAGYALLRNSVRQDAPVTRASDCATPVTFRSTIV
jgi:hypothetical protein